MAKDNIELLRQSLGAAEASLRLAKQLLSEIERGGSVVKVSSKPPVPEVPGILGIFDGENMITEDKQVIPVPSNYASKSMLIPGDTLKLIEEGKEKRFKQVDHVKRFKTSGILAKKDGKWSVLAPEGSYKVLPASVSHFSVDVGSEVNIFLPDGNLTVTYAAIESVKGVSSTDVKKETKDTVAAPVAVEPVKEEKKPEPKVEKKEEPKPEVKVAPVKTPEPKVETPAPKTAPVVQEVSAPVEKAAPAPKPEVKEEITPAVTEPTEVPAAPVASSGEDELT